jgi:hypothetical protein
MMNSITELHLVGISTESKHNGISSGEGKGISSLLPHPN